MIKIPLSRGYIATVDDIDKDLALVRWNASTGRGIYAKRHPQNETKTLHEETQLLHRVIMERILMRPLQEGEVIDFKNRNTLDCTRGNLALGSYSAAGAKRKLDRRSKTGYKGVSFKKAKGMYEAWIRVNYEGIYLGTYTCAEDAARAYDKAAREHHGSKARLNFPDD